MNSASELHLTNTRPRRSPPGDGDITVRLVEPGHLEEDYPVTTFFLKAIDSQVFFFADGPNNIKVQLSNR